jgi:oligoendopeptidase F
MAGMMAEKGWVDAPSYKGKQSGAFNYSVALPPPYGNRSYTLMNYLGTERDVMTLAHEFGHGVHGLLAAEAQGPLLFQAPLAYAETASIFGEMLVFEHLVKQARTPGAELALLMEKSSDFINSVVRQIGFSFFEQRAHAARKNGKLTTKDFCGLWIDGTAELYGPEGEIFTYSDIDYLWSYVSHFMNPFYVYAYAFGELLTQSLFVMRSALGKSFEPKYLDLLRAGGSKDAGELLKPFDLDPNDPTFWARGIGLSLGKWLDRAEELERTLNAPH